MSRPRRTPLPGIGHRFGRWVVSGSVFMSGDTWSRAMAPCTCDCGARRDVSVKSLQAGTSASCGCLKREASRQTNTTHGQSRTRLYNTWCHMRRRCLDPAADRGGRYFHRGITVCPEWLHDFSAFAAWSESAGYTPHLMIDRIDNDGSYSPENCRWTTSVVNNRNKSNNRQLSALGETKTLAEWVNDPRCSVGRPTLSDRINHGWDHERAITEAPRG